jgi:hypothetical protein
MQRGHSFKLVKNFGEEQKHWKKETPWKEELQSFEEIYGEKVIHFNDICPDLYRIKSKKNHGVDEYGGTLYVLKLQDTNKNCFHVWAPTSLANCMKSDDQKSYILKHGLLTDNYGGSFQGFSLY